MIKNFIIVGLLWLAVRFVWLIDMVTLHGWVERLCAESQATLLTIGGGIVVSIAVVAYLLSALRWYTPLYLLSVAVFESSQFVIVLLSVSAVVFRLVDGSNLWMALGPAAGALPFLVLAASCFSFWLYDFNLPLQKRLLYNVAVPVLSGILVAAIPYFL